MQGGHIQYTQKSFTSVKTTQCCCASIMEKWCKRHGKSWKNHGIWFGKSVGNPDLNTASVCQLQFVFIEEERGDGDRIWDTRFWDKQHINEAASRLAERIESESEASGKDEFYQIQLGKEEGNKIKTTNIRSMKRKVCTTHFVSNLQRIISSIEMIIKCVHYWYPRRKVYNFW